MSGSIYMIWQIGTDRYYVGKTGREPNKRWNDHRRDLRANKHSSRALQHAWNKYGRNAFHFETIEFVADEDDLGKREAHWVREYRAYFNTMQPDADGAFRHDQDTIDRIREAAIALWENPNHRERMQALMSDPEMQALISEHRLAMWQDPQHRAKVSEAHDRYWSDQKNRDRVSALMLDQWLDPAFQEAMARRLSNPEIRERFVKSCSQRMTAIWADPEERTKLEAAFVKAWECPKLRAKVGSIQKLIYRRPGRRELQSQNGLAIWADPEKRKRILAGRHKPNKAQLSLFGEGT